jgi:hypothetical protein
MEKLRKKLSAPGLIEIAIEEFSKIEDHKKRNSKISLRDCLTSGLALFGLKYPSLLQFEIGMNDNEKLVRHNLGNLYQIKQVPSDTYMREELDQVNPEELRTAFVKIYQELQRGKELEGYEFLNGYYLVAVDGTGYFYSDKVHCEHCCERNHQDGSVSYYHQMLAASIVHPDKKQVIPMCPEPILKQDGAKKNDCEQNSAKRLLKKIVEEHPKLPMIVVQDALSANGPHIEFLKSLDLRYIIGVKPKDHQLLFDWFEKSEKETLTITRGEVIHQFRFINGIPLNGANLGKIDVNFLEYTEIKKGKKTAFFTWITDLKITSQNVEQIMRGARARWKIENETFNTLKNQGYQFEHNFGHGKKYLSTVMAYLMMLAFLIDQVQEIACTLFKKALQQKKNNRKALWNHLREAFDCFKIKSWESLLFYLANPYSFRPELPDSS